MSTECHDTTCPMHNKTEPFCDELVCIKKPGILTDTKFCVRCQKPTEHEIIKDASNQTKLVCLTCLMENQTTISPCTLEGYHSHLKMANPEWEFCPYCATPLEKGLADLKKKEQ